MGALCCHHASSNGPVAADPNRNEGLRPESSRNHSPTHPHRHGLNDRSDIHRRCLAHVDGQSWAQVAGCSADATEIRLPRKPM